MTTTTDTQPAATDVDTADAFAERVFASALGMAETMAIYVGDRLGWYRCLAEGGPASPSELAASTGTAERYAREWLEQQAAGGILTVDDTGAERRFGLPAAAAEVLTDGTSLAYLAPLARMFAASAQQLPALLGAYRDGGGVSWQQFGVDARESQADMNRPWLEQQLPPALAGVATVHERLNRPGARIADVGSGAGWSSIALARAYPHAQVAGFDVDDPSIELARTNAQDAGLTDRVQFHAADGDGLGASGPYDAVFAFECIHDMARPVEVLTAMREAVADDGVVVIMDEAVGDHFSAPGDDVERLMYAFSLFVCLPDGMSHHPSAGTGTVMRPDTLRSYARQAGFSDLRVLPIEDFGFWRFYQLHQ